MKGLLLLSGGFDSPVALDAMKGLADFEAIHFHYYPVTDKSSQDKAIALARLLGLSRVHVAPIAPIEAEILKHCDKKLFFVLSKRMMLRIAEQIAHDIGATFLVTGESLGQVASQTLQNLSTIASAVCMPVYRPLLAMNKQEIIEEAKTIGTFETSKGPEICNLLGPKHPSTHAGQHQVEAAEKRVDVDALVRGAVETVEVITL